MNPKTARIGQSKGETHEASNDDAERVRSGLRSCPARLGAGQELPTQTITIAGTIETIDKGKRAMNIKTADGKFVAVNVPESVKRFDELKVGDKIKATYNNNVIVRLKPAGEAAVEPLKRPPPRGSPAARRRWCGG